MTSLSRTSSKDSAASAQMSPTGLDCTGTQMPDLTASGQQDVSRSGTSPAASGRPQSHSLLSSSPSHTLASRKSRFADAGTVGGNVRASLSMPPPATKPSSRYRPANARSPSVLTLTTDTSENLSGPGMVKDTLVSVNGSTSGELQRIASVPDTSASVLSETQSPSRPPDASLRPPIPGSDKPGDRLSLSSLYSLGSVIYDKATGQSSASPSAASSTAGSVKGGGFEQPATIPLSPSLGGSAKADPVSGATTATDPISVTAYSQHLHHQVPLPVSKEGSAPVPVTVTNAAAKHLDSWNTGPISRPSAPRRSRSKTKTQRQPSGSTVTSSAASPTNSDRIKPPIGKVGVCALDVKARSKASRNILTRLSKYGDFEVIIFGDKVILDEEVENWPVCDFLISFFSDGFPLDKAIAYSELRQPFCINDLPMQKILWDRRICLRVLDSMGVPVPERIEVNRDGGPTFESAQLADHVYRFSGVRLPGPEDGTGGGVPITQNVGLTDDGDTLQVDGLTLRKPFVEKPISGEDHNIHIYFPKSHQGGGGRRLFRKIGNKSSEWDQDLVTPRSVTETESSYIYEKFLLVDNAEDIKAYTVGPEYCHAETRTSPVVDGLVRRNTHGKEIRYICKLSADEQLIAKKVANGFGQRICGFDMLRVNDRSYVIDVNGWSFVKDNNDYYDKCASILKQMFTALKNGPEDSLHNIDGRGDKTMDEQSGEKGAVEQGMPHRKGTHRAALKGIIKSPSMSKLKGLHPSGHGSHAANVQDENATASPLSSPPNIENDLRHPPPVLPSVKGDALPSPTLPMDQTVQTPASTMQPSAKSVPEPSAKHSWKLKGMVSVVRHADRTPKQKFKFTFHTQPFVELLRGHQEEVLLKGEAALSSVMDAVKVAMREGIEDPSKLQLLRTSLARKGAWTGTKVQIKPMFRKRKPEEIVSAKNDDEGLAQSAFLAGEAISEEPEEEETSVKRPPTRSDSLTATTLSRYSAVENDLVLDKLQLIVKWGGEPTHSARYQSQDLGENMRNDLLLMNKESLEDVHVFTSSERRVSTSAQIWAASFLNQNEVPESSIVVRKDLLDDSNAAKDVMDKVKKKLKLLLREGHQPDPQFAWPPNTPEPSTVVRKVAGLMNYHRKVMRYNFKKLNSGATASLKAINATGDGASHMVNTAGGSLAQAQMVNSIQARWCCGEDPELFKERWEKLFTEFCDSEKVDPSKISELYDTMKFDALHNRQFLEWVFTPGSNMPDEEDDETLGSVMEPPSDPIPSSSSHSLFKHRRKGSNGNSDDTSDKSVDRTNSNLAHRMGLRRKSVMNSITPPANPVPDSHESYFKLYPGTGQTKAKLDARLEKLRELYKLAKVLFDFVCPQEYGISNEEKLEIGLLTSLPLLKEIVHDLEDVQASDDAKSFIYFTKESHIYTLLNCILEGGIKTKIERNAIPELDYLSHITFELYESEDKDLDTFTYSIRISISPGCHTADPLDVQLDSKHSIGYAPRRTLTAHSDWKEVIETLRGKFGTVKLPKSFLAINVSDSHKSEAKPGDEEAPGRAVMDGQKKDDAVGVVDVDGAVVKDESAGPE